MGCLIIFGTRIGSHFCGVTDGSGSASNVKQYTDPHLKVMWIRIRKNNLAYRPFYDAAEGSSTIEGSSQSTVAAAGVCVYFVTFYLYICTSDGLLGVFLSNFYCFFEIFTDNFSDKAQDFLTLAYYVYLF
jgi:hypothetical protein